MNYGMSFGKKIYLEKDSFSNRSYIDIPYDEKLRSDVQGNFETLIGELSKILQEQDKRITDLEKGLK